MKDFLVILRRNFVSPIVIAILVLATTLLLLGESRDAFFISVVIVVNTLFAIVQEVRAQRALKKLELMSAPRARRQIDDDKYEEVMFDQLQADDTIKLLAGDEIPADAVLITSAGLEVNESILTGESASIERDVKALVLAGSAVVAGSAIAKVVAVGVDSKAGQMTATLKRYTPQLTPLQQAIDRAITYLTYGALALATLIFVVYIAAGQDAVSIFKTITSAAVTVVPEGLLLASSLLLAFGSLKLAKAQVLPQKLAAIEAMAILSVLCVDKTGTLTSDEVTFESLELFDKSADEKHWQRIVGIVAEGTSGGNATGDAIISGLPAPKTYEVIETLAFSSERKMSGVRMKLDGKTHTVLIGASEFLGKLAPIDAMQKKHVEALASEGKRVLLVASFNDNNVKLKNLKTNSGSAIGLIVLSNPLRVGVEKTVAYLQKNDVSIRVISGDNPQTVQYIAAKAGIASSDKITTGAELAKLNDYDWDTMVMKTTIFARVLPEQKERLIATFQKHDKFTGMVGDGVNDALALKKADLGVAMYAGAAASRRVADIVLLNNSFTSLPLGMKLGNRIMQAIEIISLLFFHKIIFGIVLLLSTLAMGMMYPFEPRHVTFMNIFLVTLPTLMWTLFPPVPQHRVNPKHFWRDTLKAVAPIAMISGIAVTFTYWAISNLYPGSRDDIATTMVIVATFFGIYLVFLASRMLGVANNNSARMSRFLYIFTAIVISVASFGSGFLRDFFDFTQPNWLYLWPALLVMALAAILQYRLALRAGEKLKQSHYRI
jgi:cation-transporting P-type ATPase E